MNPKTLTHKPKLFLWSCTVVTLGLLTIGIRFFSCTRTDRRLEPIIIYKAAPIEEMNIQQGNAPTRKKGDPKPTERGKNVRSMHTRMMDTRIQGTLVTKLQRQNFKKQRLWARLSARIIPTQKRKHLPPRS